MRPNPITIADLSYTYPDGTVALGGISFSIRASQRVAVVGANGSGKSTLLLHLNGIFLAQTGSLIVGGYSVEPAHLKWVRNFVGLVFQNPEDQLFMPTVAEDVGFGPLNQGVQPDQLPLRVNMALKAVGLDPLSYGPRIVHNLSGGEKKRVAIAGVLAMEPQILVLDEPSAQLDPRSRRQFIQLLQTLPQTQLIATHDLDLALELCDRTIVLSQGRVVADGPTGQILSDVAFLEHHHLESPLCFSRPYCLLQDHPESPNSIREWIDSATHPLLTGCDLRD
jgi:cobalt/nickel transport system ATP-binding protein